MGCRTALARSRKPSSNRGKALASTSSQNQSSSSAARGRNPSFKSTVRPTQSQLFRVVSTTNSNRQIFCNNYSLRCSQQQRADIGKQGDRMGKKVVFNGEF